MNTQPRYTVEPDNAGPNWPVRWVIRDTQTPLGTQILAVLQSQLAAEQAAQALNRGLVASVDAQGRWEDAP